MLSRPAIPVLVACIGFSAVIAQITLMRELMTVSYGNEISLGIMLAAWLLWTAVGSGVFGKLAVRAANPRLAMATLQIALALLFPATIVAVRTSRTILRASPGEILGPDLVFLICVVSLSGLCAVSGCLFVSASRLYEQELSISSAHATSSAYLFEAAGSALGGILASLFLIAYVNSLELAVLVSLINFAAATTLLARSRMIRGAAFAVLLLGVVFLSAWTRSLESRSLARLWPGFELAATRNSPYGNLAVVESTGTRSLFENGLLMFNAADTSAAEEAVHFALLQHPAPRSLLLIGGGPSGSLLQALQHPSLQRVDYVELDPAVLDIANDYFSEQWDPARLDPRVNIHHADGRLWLKLTRRTFDVIVINLPDPQTAQLNRFYTLEFFQEAATKLSPTGILSFQLHAAEEYISPELAGFLRCIHKTLREVFPSVVMIPGESVHFFAARQAGSLTADPQELILRLRNRTLQTRYVREYYIPYRMMPDRMLDLQQQLEPAADTPVNRDFSPVAYYFDLALWSIQFHRGYRPVFRALAQIKFPHVLTAAIALSLLFAAVLRWLPQRSARPRSIAAFSIAVMGMTLISLEVLLLLGFQAIYGFVYQQLAIVIAFFMVGMALGTWLALRKTRGPADPGAARHDMLKLGGLEFLAALSAPFLYLCFIALAGVTQSTALAFVSQVLFPALALLCGLLGGYVFPVASAIFFADSKNKSLGTLYAVDLAGACIGALVISAYLLPVFGFLKSAELIAVVNLVAALTACSVALAPADPQC